MLRQANSQPLRVAFIVGRSDGWVAGTHYAKSLWAALKSLPHGCRPEVILVDLSAAQTNSYDEFGSNIDQVLCWPPSHARSTLWHHRMLEIQRRLGVWLWSQPSLDAFLREHRVDCAFSSTHFGWRFSTPLLTWIPDFQHLHLQEMFSPQEVQRRSRVYSQIASHSDRIILSSQNAVRDFERFAPHAVRKARLLSFVAQTPAEAYSQDPAWICDHYHLPRRFVYLPNQFWKHKNHKTVIDALAYVVKKRPEMAVVCTGSTSDHRDPLYFARLLESVSVSGVRDNLILLGFVPHTHVFLLMRQSLAVLQPSLFEGWSTTVEEAKSLGKRMILSDIAVHREQDPPQVVFFDPHEPLALADCLVTVFDEVRPGPDHELEELAQEQLPKRTVEFGRSFMQIVEEVVTA